MIQKKSKFTIILPVMCIIGIIILIYVWNKNETPTKNLIKIDGPKTAPTQK